MFSTSGTNGEVDSCWFDTILDASSLPKDLSELATLIFPLSSVVSSKGSKSKSKLGLPSCTTSLYFFQVQALEK